MNNIPNSILALLEKRKTNNSFRKLKTDFPEIDFCSNDYLGFSKLETTKNVIEDLNKSQLSIKNRQSKSGSTGSRLISGNSVFIEQVEKEIANFHSVESALIFNSGYDANVGLLSSVPQKNDLILFDELSHASIYDGIRLSYAKHFKFKHNDTNSLKDLLQRHVANYENIYVVVESIYSMDGDAAPLKEIVDLLHQFTNCFLIVDEAHALGIFGEKGKGLCNELNLENVFFARIYTYGKAIGAHGAAVVGSNHLRNYLINFARSFIYTTALPKSSIESIQRGYQLLSGEVNMQLLKNNIAYFTTNCKNINGLIASNSAIQSIILGNNNDVDEIENKLAEQHIYAKAIKSPTVKAGTERIRICLHAFNTYKEIDLLINTLQKHG